MAEQPDALELDAWPDWATVPKVFEGGGCGARMMQGCQQDALHHKVRDVRVVAEQRRIQPLSTATYAIAQSPSNI